jgi:hypothetical protein
MSTRNWIIKPSLTHRLILGATAAGLEVERVDFDPATGRISVIPKSAANKQIENDRPNSFDQVLGQ